MNCDMKRSISLYSYQDEYYDGKLDLEGCLRETAKTGATGVELLAEQMIKKFPLPIETEEFREQWFGWLEKYHLTPSCYDAFLENRIFDNRTLCLGEQINMMKRDIRLASLLGFHNLRTLVSTPMEVIEGSLAYAQQMDVRIGLEVHAPFCILKLLRVCIRNSYKINILKCFHHIRIAMSHKAKSNNPEFDFLPEYSRRCKR